MAVSSSMRLPSSKFPRLFTRRVPNAAVLRRLSFLAHPLVPHAGNLLRSAKAIFAFFKQLEQALGIKVYFAKPYYSWERGTNESRNGVVRKILPKGSAFDAILDEEMRRIDRMLNDRPLKCLDWRTPREAFTALLHRHLLAAA